MKAKNPDFVIKQKKSAKYYNLTKIRPYWGAIATGIDLSKPIDKATIKQINDDVHKYRLICFKKQKLSGAKQVQISEYFGKI